MDLSLKLAIQPDILLTYNIPFWQALIAIIAEITTQCEEIRQQLTK